MNPTETATVTEPQPKGGLLREWVLPIAAGLVIGALLVYAWKHGRHLFRSEAENLVRQWAVYEFDANDELEEKLRKLGKDSRADLLAAFRRIEVPPNPYGEDEQKVWAARILAGDPFFDTRSLLEVVRDPAEPVWDRRAAAAALVHTLQKDVDTTAVTPVLLEWLEDTKVYSHTIPMTSIGQLRSDRVFAPDQEPRLRAGLLRIATRSGSRSPADEEDAERQQNDRETAVHFLGDFLTEDDAKAALWGIAVDDSDSSSVRSAAVQVLVAGKQLDDVGGWKVVAKARDPIVRQTVADNLASCPDPAFDAVLAPLHEDEGEFVRKSSIEAQVARNRPTMLPVADLLLEDVSPYVRFETLVACGVFKNHLDGMGARQGMILRLLETSDADEDIHGAILALHMITGRTFGFGSGDVDVARREVSDTWTASFKVDAEDRRKTVQQWREHLGGTAVWTDGDRRQVLDKLLNHADPANRDRAKAELAKRKP